MYNEIASNKRRTWALIILVSAFVIVLCAFVGYAAGVDASSSIVLGTIFATTYSLFAYYLGDKMVLATHRAHPITKQEAPDLWNLVENLAIAQGLPMPKVYVINDPSPNAFATGRNPETASVTFTTGILALLEKTELEGVAAHELSHIKNYDIRLMTITVVLVGLIMLAADILLHIRPRRNDNGQAALILMLVGLALAILSPFIAQLIKLAVSRTREYLADASGALLTRYPEGLASALLKIEAASSARPLTRANHATAHLFISNPFGGQKRSWMAGLFSTHPPTEARVEKLRSMGI